MALQDEISYGRSISARRRRNTKRVIFWHLRKNTPVVESKSVRDKEREKRESHFPGRRESQNHITGGVRERGGGRRRGSHLLPCLTLRLRRANRRRRGGRETAEKWENKTESYTKEPLHSSAAGEKREEERERERPKKNVEVDLAAAQASEQTGAHMELAKQTNRRHARREDRRERESEKVFTLLKK